MERAGRVHVRCGKEEEAQTLAAGECNQVAGFCFLGVGKEARHFNSDKEGGRTSNSNSLDSVVGDGAVRREALRTGVDNLNDCLEQRLQAGVSAHRSAFGCASRFPWE